MTKVTPIGKVYRLFSPETGESYTHLGLPVGETDIHKAHLLNALFDLVTTRDEQCQDEHLIIQVLAHDYSDNCDRWRK